MLGHVTALDDTVGKVVELYKRHGYWENTILVFSSDNKRFNFDKSDQEKLPTKSGSTASLEWDATQGQIYYNSVLHFF